VRAINPIKTWINALEASHTKNTNTKIGYIRDFNKFLTFSEVTADQIINDYEEIGGYIQEKRIRRKYTRLIIEYMGTLKEDGYLPSSVQNAIHAIKSFFKYHNLHLDNIIMGKVHYPLHNRDITKEEIEEIIKVSKPREKAFYALMVQSGLRPDTLCKLKIEDIEGLTKENTPIPALITVNEEATKGQYSSYFTFAGKEAIYYLKEYLKRKQPLQPTDQLFTHDEGNREPIQTDLISHIFRRTITKLKKEQILTFNNKKSEKTNRNDLRLYNLRKYFRNTTGAGTDFTNYWMGHSLGVDGHYFTQDIEKHREKYKETALANLRIDTKTPNETEATITKLETENKELKQRLTRIEKLLEKIGERPEPTPEEQNQINQEIEERANAYEKWLQEHPRELKKDQKQHTEQEKYLIKHPEIDEEVKQLDKEYIEEKIKEFENSLTELKKLINTNKQN
jgi:integrase